MSKWKTPFLTFRRQWLVYGFIASLLSSAVAVNLYHEKNVLKHREQTKLIAISKVVEVSLEQNLISINQSLVSIRTALNGGLSPDKFNTHLHDIANAISAVRTIFVVDATGTMVFASRPELLQIDKNYSERDYFQGPKNNPNLKTLYISAPFRTVLGTYTIALSRAITGPNGEFSGVITSIIDPAYFYPLLESVRFDPSVSTSLYQGDGNVFLMIPPSTNTERIKAKSIETDRVVKSSDTELRALFMQHRTSGLDVNLLSGSVFADGDEHMMVLRNVQPIAIAMDKPIDVVISRLLRNIYGPWWHDVLIASSATTITLLLFALALYAYQRRQQEFLETQALFNLSIKSIQDGFLLYGKHGDIIKSNLIAEQTTGFSPSQLTGVEPIASDRRIIFEDGSDIPLADFPFTASLRQGIVIHNAIIGIHSPVDRLTWILLNSAPIGNPQRPNGAIVTFVDITERKRILDALKESDMRLKLALNTNKIGLWDWNLRTGYVFRTDQIYAASGYDPEDDTHDFSFFVRTVHPHDLDEVRKHVNDYRNGISSKLAFEFRLLNKQNISARWMLVIGHIVERDEHGTPMRIIGTQTDITDRRNDISALQASEKQLRLATEMADIAVWEYDAQKNEMSRTSNHDKLYGMDGQEIWHAETFLNATHPNHREYANQITQGALAPGGPDQYAFDFPVIWPDGSMHWLWVKGEVVKRDQAGQGLGLRGILIDVSQRKLSEEKLQLAANVFTYAREGITITDADGCILEVNDMFTHISGYSREEAVGQNPRILKSGRHNKAFYITMWHALTNQGYWSGEVWNRRKNGELYAVMLTISVVYDDAGLISSYVSLYSDITTAKQHQSELEHLAHYDSLTGLPNRLLLSDRLRQAIAQSIRKGTSVAVVYLDLDNIKTVNDTYGHDMGDSVLISLAATMETALRDCDSIARMGGDEFVAILTDLDQTQDCIPVLERLLAAATTPVHLTESEMHNGRTNEQQVQVSASIGVTFYPQDNVDADVLLRHADQAMYLAKQLGKNRFHLFDVAQEAAIQSHQGDIKRIKEALDKNEFILYYQPKINMQTNDVIGAEALIRWLHPERGLLPPVEFLPIFENHPLGIQIGEWVIKSALTQMETWHNAHLDFMVSVNISAHQLQQSNFPERLGALLATTPDVHPHYLQLEVLETTALENMDKVMGIMQACHALGVSFALDDFGTGYSSLTYLRRLPVKVLKIDQSFVRDMTDDADDLAIVQGVIGLARNFNRQVIAEGVESKAHRDLLLEIGCDLAQGYGIARPMPAEKMQGWVESWQKKPVWTA
jgi:diguanylate cyclase (GGDEF)-like protein/PAS domain S-box-containing protein